MRVLLLRPDPGHERFGLGPFFRVEPLGLEYIGAALRARGHEPRIADLRFRPGLDTWIRRTRPQLVGISCLHSLEYDQVRATARAVRLAAPEAFVLVGGHAAAAFPGPLECDEIDAICLDDGEEIVPALVEAIERGAPLDRLPGLRLRVGGAWLATPPRTALPDLDCVRVPARDLVAQHRNGYHCLLFKPIWLVETARGCPYRCSFCSVWQLYDRAYRERSVAAVVEDVASAGDAIFVADDLFWHHPARSRELAEALRRRGVSKRWILVQTRADIISRQTELLQVWRPLAKDFDIFFGFEAASDAGLAQVDKDAGVGASLEAVRIARSLGYGVNGNFLIDPDWTEMRFAELWDFVARHDLRRAGFTILTPLPGTEFFDRLAPRLAGQPWHAYDMHHLLWEPRLGARRFFELYAETWRRSILNASGDKTWLDWVRQVRPTMVPYLLRVLWRTQRMMKPEAYLGEYEATNRTCPRVPTGATTESQRGGGHRSVIAAAGNEQGTVAVETVVDTSDRPKPFRHVLAAPWFYRLGFAAARAVPVPVLYGIADGLGVATYLTNGRLVAAMRANLTRAFPQASERERSRLVRRILRNYVRYLVDYGRFRWARREGFEALIPALEGKDHLLGALDAGQGVILVTGHVGNWELGGTFFGQSGVKVHVVTLPDGHRQIDAIRERYRGRHAINTIVLDGSPFASLEMMAALRRGELVAMLVDRWGDADGIASPFFGGTHHLPRGPFVLSRTTGAPILPAFVVRDGASYLGIVEPSFVVAGDDLGPYAARVSGALERVIRRYPDQWYNFIPV